MTTKEMINVMQAYERGEQIEYRMKTIPENDEWDTMTQKPEWSWNNFEYRIKSKPTYRAYQNAEEFLQAQKEHGMYLIRANSNTYIMILYVNNTAVFVPAINCDNNIVDIELLYKELLNNYTWQDGTPCGVEE